MPHLLIIEDDIDILASLVDLMEIEDIEVETAVDGDKGMAALTANPPTMIITDLFMPIMDGFKFVCAARESGYKKKIFIMSGGGKNDQEAFQKALDMGATDIIKKPFEADDLVALVKKCIEEDA